MTTDLRRRPRSNARIGVGVFGGMLFSACAGISSPIEPFLRERAIARIERRARELEEEMRWWDLPILGAPVAVAALAFLVAGRSPDSVIPPASVAIGAIVSGSWPCCTPGTDPGGRPGTYCRQRSTA